MRVRNKNKVFYLLFFWHDPKEPKVLAPDRLAYSYFGQYSGKVANFFILKYEKKSPGDG